MPAVMTNENDVLTVRIIGDVDHHAAKDLRADIDRELERTLPKSLVFDLTECDFMDSSGLGLIMGRYRKTAGAGCGFTLVNPAPKTLKILRMAGVDKLLDIRCL